MASRAIIALLFFVFSGLVLVTLINRGLSKPPIDKAVQYPTASSFQTIVLVNKRSHRAFVRLFGRECYVWWSSETIDVKRYSEEIEFRKLSSNPVRVVWGKLNTKRCGQQPHPVPLEPNYAMPLDVFTDWLGLPRRKHFASYAAATTARSQTKTATTPATRTSIRTTSSTSRGQTLTDFMREQEERMALSRDLRKLVQQGLRRSGYDVGAIDGIFGPRTRQAIRRWQSDNQRAASGYINSAQFRMITKGSDQ